MVSRMRLAVFLFACAMFAPLVLLCKTLCADFSLEGFPSGSWSKTGSVSKSIDSSLFFPTGA